MIVLNESFLVKLVCLLPVSVAYMVLLFLIFLV